MIIAKANIADTKALTMLVNSAYRGESSKQGWTTESHLIDGLRIDDITMLAYLQDDKVTILKYLDDQQQLKGCVYLEYSYTYLYLGMLTVAPNKQNKGIGKLLLKAAEAYALDKSCDSITITVISSRSELIAWYERHGFVATGEIRPFPKDDKFGIVKTHIELMVMEKRLPAAKTEKVH